MALFRISSMRAPVRRCNTFLRPIGAQRTFQSCRVLAVGKESAVHEENRAEKVEAEKQEQLNKAKKGENEWEEELASDSESIVKADRNQLKDSSETIAELQQESVKQAERDRDRQK